MEFVNKNAEAYAPPSLGNFLSPQEICAAAQGGSMGIAAHQDDLEILAIKGIGEHQRDGRFVGVTVTDGRGCPRAGDYENRTDDEMATLRHEEQKAAATLGRYAVFQLGYPSNSIKGPNPPQGDALEEELLAILMMARPKTVYLHNPFDRHATHNAVTRAALNALRRMPHTMQPDAVYGCEVWGSLDWLPDDEKITLDVTPYIDLQDALLRCFVSQLAYKDYHKGTVGREFANATYSDAHSIDKNAAVIYAVNLKPLLDPDASLEDFIHKLTQRFADECLQRARDNNLQPMKKTF